jgi:hypothetical protein
MGMTKRDIERINLEEATSNIVSATIIGFFVGHYLALVFDALLKTILEEKMDYSIEWNIFIALLILSSGVVGLGTKISTSIV